MYVATSLGVAEGVGFSVEGGYYARAGIRSLFQNVRKLIETAVTHFSSIYSQNNGRKCGFGSPGY